MEKERSLLKWALIFVAVAIFLIGGTDALRVEALSGSSVPSRPDVITIDMSADFGALERPEVVFLHDLHTDALEKKNKDCTTCHLAENGRLSLKLKRLTDTGRQAVMDIYHDNCTACHRKMRAAKEKTGPVVCRGCHKKKQAVISSRVPMGFDKSLHFRHVQAQKNKCERCHHEYDPKSKKLFYAKDKEGTCRYCHKQETRDLVSERRISMRLASHLACIDCHRKTIAKQMIAGPVKCNDCHDLEAQEMIAKVDTVPRMKPKLPDFILIKADIKNSHETLMNFVPFSHKAHERYNDTCRVCHHVDLKSCTGCHSLTGGQEGNYVTLKQAMHQLGNQQSCLGCHEQNQHDQSCAGCHAFLEKGRKQHETSCLKCHMAPSPEITGNLSKSGEIKMARMLPEIWWAIFGSKRDIDVPQKVVIKELSNLYQPVEFPHGKIVKALQKKIDGNKLAAYFHLEEGTLCQGCHHNSPATKKPPKCGSCHGRSFDEKNLFAPRLMGAYHQQCMGCHDKMGIEKPVKVDCTACHNEKQKT